jgi:hypothetical protein
MIKLGKIRWAGSVANTLKITNAYKIVAGKPEGKRVLG